MRESKNFNSGNSSILNRPKTAHLSQSLNKYDQVDNNEIINNKLNNSEVYDIIDQIQHKYDNSSLKPILKDEENQVELISNHKDKLTHINLIESNIEELYEWKTLFNQSRPISAYTRLNSAKENLKAPEKEELTIQERMIMQNPVALIDASNEVIASYIPNYEPESSIPFPKKEGNSILRQSSRSSGEKQSNQKNSSIIRPTSMNGPRRKIETFYFSKDFSNYYNEELKTFAKKMPLVRAKVHVDRSKLNKAMKIIRSQSVEKEFNLKSIRDNNKLLISDQHVVLAGNSGNSRPLLESIYMQLHPDYVENVQKKKYYRNTAKPLGDYTNRENYAVNCRDMHRYQIRAMREESNNKKTSRMGLEYDLYDENDPSVKMFMNLISNAQNVESIIDHNKEAEVDTIDKDREKEQNKDHEQEQEQEIKLDNHHRGRVCINEDDQTERSSIQNNIRPKTGFVRQDASAILKKRLIGSGKKRPMSSQYSNRGFMYISYNPNCKIADINTSHRQYNDLSSFGCSQRNTCDNSIITCEFIPVKCLPTKTSSLIKNKTYQKINQTLKNKREEKKNMNHKCFNEYSKSSSNFFEIAPHITTKFNQFKSYRDKAAQNNTNTDKETTTEYYKLKKNLTMTKSDNWMKVNLIYFNDYIDSNIQPERINVIKAEESNVMNPVNYFNKNAKVYYAKKNNKEPTFSQVHSLKSIRDKKRNASFRNNKDN